MLGVCAYVYVCVCVSFSFIGGDDRKPWKERSLAEGIPIKN